MTDPIRRLRRGILEVTLSGDTENRRQFTTPKRGLVSALQAQGYGVSNERELLEALWQLVAERLIFPDFTFGYPQPDNWVSETESWIWRLTPRGSKVAQAT